MNYKAKDYSHLIGMDGFSKKLLEDHFTLYHAYVENTNKLLERLSHLEQDAKLPEYAELKRRFGWEFNGMRLHEYYFDNLGGKNFLKKSPFQKALENEFGSYAVWDTDFRATASLRGIGWAILYRDVTGQLFNAWVNEHDTGHLAGCTPLLVLDAFEHAFLTDYGLKREEYIEAFMQNVDWEAAITRFDISQRLEPVTISA